MLESIGESSLVRLALVLTVVLGVQSSILSEVRPFGGIIDLVAILAVVAGLVAGPRRGGRAAFVFGLVFDLLIATPFGIKGLAYGLAAVSIGLLPAEPISNLKFLTSIICASGAALATLMEGVVAAIFGRSEALSRDLLASMAVTAVLAALLGPLLLRVMRWAMMAADRGRI